MITSDILRKIRRRGEFFLFYISALTITGSHLFSQDASYPFDIPHYDFIRYDLNSFVFPSDSSSFQHLMQAYSRLVTEGEGKLSVVHIGGSHLQADIYSHRIRQRMQTLEPGINGGRGFIFPYSLARTNNPSNYKVSYTGRWTGCRNVEKTRDCILGLAGISATTYDSTAVIRISFPDSNELSYEFNRVKIFFLDDSLSYECLASSGAGEGVAMQQEPGIASFQFRGYSDSLIISIRKNSPSQGRFTLMGVSLDTDDPGLVYHAIGVNGAKLSSYLRCSLFADHLKALQPDLVVLSIGTNDAYTRYFDSKLYRSDYDILLDVILEAVPETAVILTVPNDSYLYRRYVNPNTQVMGKVIRDLAAERGLGVWDFYSIMGGLNSITLWQRFGLAKRDRIHFTTSGYLLKGDLFFNAFLKSYDNYVEFITAK